MGIKVLDCTLRDGAYVTEALFENDRIKGIINNLSESGVDIIECGWLRNCVHQENSVLFEVPNEVEKYIVEKKSQLSLMFDYGKYELSKLSQNNGLIDIIRIAFYKKSLDEVCFAAEKVKSKGYKVFLQASNIKEYSEKDIEKLCKRANHLGVNSVYIVDTFGSLFPEDLEKIMPIFSETVKESIEIGFHCHNNIQMALALSIQFMNKMNRDIIVDSTLCGIGRGAGNTKTELLLEYLNRQKNRFNTELIWQTCEKYIAPLYQTHNWEYTPEKGLLGINNLHP